MLGDSDARIRNEAAIAIFEFNKFQVSRHSPATNKYSGVYLRVAFVAETLSNEIPYALESESGTLTGVHPDLCNDADAERHLKRLIGKHSGNAF